MRHDSRWRHRELDRLLQLHRLDLLRHVHASSPSPQEEQPQLGTTLQGIEQGWPNFFDRAGQI